MRAIMRRLKRLGSSGGAVSSGWMIAISETCAGSSSLKVSPFTSDTSRDAAASVDPGTEIPGTERDIRPLLRPAQFATVERADVREQAVDRVLRHGREILLRLPESLRADRLSPARQRSCLLECACGRINQTARREP